MFSQRVRQVMGRERLLVAPPHSSVSEAARLMAGDGVSAVVVVDAERPVGIFTGRDVIRRVIAPGRDPHATRLAEVMTAEPITVGPDKLFGHALMLMQESGFRHLPVLDDGKLVGIVSSRNAMDPEMEEFIAEAARRDGYR